MMGWNHGGWDRGDWLAMSLLMLLFWVLVVVLVTWLARGFRRGSPHGDATGAGRPPMAAAAEVLAVRFARGEINADQFERQRKVLDGH